MLRVDASISTSVLRFSLHPYVPAPTLCVVGLALRAVSNKLRQTKWARILSPYNLLMGYRESSGRHAENPASCRARVIGFMLYCCHDPAQHRPLDAANSCGTLDAIPLPLPPLRLSTHHHVCHLRCDLSKQDFLNPKNAAQVMGTGWSQTKTTERGETCSAVITMRRKWPFFPKRCANYHSMRSDYTRGRRHFGWYPIHFLTKTYILRLIGLLIGGPG